MDKHYQPLKTEEKIYQMWEKGGYFTPKIKPKKKPFTILLPLPNANDPLHIGHALFTIEDILCRWHRMKGEPVLWLPGADHAGIETQFVFEKELQKKGQSRFHYDRETLYQMIYNFVEKNRAVNKNQLKKLGFSLDWTRYHYSLQPKILKIVFDTFRKLHHDNLIYRAEKMVNFCPHCGTAFSDLEIVYRQKKDPLYYLKYGPFVIATVRPETKFGDTAVAVHPQDKRYKEWVGKEFIYQSLIGPKKMKVIADKSVNPQFGTGVVKITPAHDIHDFEISQTHRLKILKIINLDGKLNENAGPFAGLNIQQARKKVVQALQKKGDLVKVDENYTHRLATCYRCQSIIEPMLMPQWFLKIKPLAKPAIKVVKTAKLKIIPSRFKKLYLQWMENIKDWNISRQIVWGPRIPAWYCLDCHPQILIEFLNKKGKKISGSYQQLKNNYPFSEIKNGLQSLTAPKQAKYALENKPCPKCAGKNILRETDTFDTWFLSAQWPLTSLGYPHSRDFKYFYPTSVLDTLWDILFFWVARMVMFGIYRTGEVPFKICHMHSRVVDKNGKKMSKSRGNVLDPMVMVEKYGADALRMALIFGAAPGTDICLSDDKVRAMRNFCNKIWNAARFVLTNLEIKNQKSKIKNTYQISKIKNKDDQWILAELNKTSHSVTKNLEKFRFDKALETLYHFFWHQFCDIYLEKTKSRQNDPQAFYILHFTFYIFLKLLHPFAPFLTEEIWQKLPPKEKDPLIISPWPK